MMTDENEQWNARSPATLGGSGASLYVYVDDVDSVFEQAQAAGLEVIAPPKDQFYGDRSCRPKDSSGYEWSIGTHIEDLDSEQCAQPYMQKMAEGGADAACGGEAVAEGLAGTSDEGDA